MLGLDTNMGQVDRLVRIALGVALLVAGFSGVVTGLWATAAKLFAWIPLFTGLVGWCPFYSLFGTRTGRR